MNAVKNFNSEYVLNNGVTVKNRLVVAPMTHWGAVAENGRITDTERAFLKDRATGFGMFITAATLVSGEGRAFLGEPFVVSKADLLDLKERADIIKAQGAKAILQIHHGGWNLLQPPAEGLQTVAPSANEEHNAVEADEKTIQHLIAAFANATALAMEAGYDGVEVHGANNYLLQQFYSAESNQREDAWGGSREKRMRFPLAVLDACIAEKEKAGNKDFIIGYRFSPEEPGEKGLTMEDTFALLDALMERPLQYLHVSLHDYYAKARRGADDTRDRMELLHAYINGRLPLIGVGNLLTGEAVEKAFAEGNAEFIALGKAVLVNPLMGELLTEGRYAEIETELDPARKEEYRFPETLWTLNMQKLDFLPRVKA